jgi:hypothetical protein
VNESLHSPWMATTSEHTTPHQDPIRAPLLMARAHSGSVNTKQYCSFLNDMNDMKWRGAQNLNYGAHGEINTTHITESLVISLSYNSVAHIQIGQTG